MRLQTVCPLRFFWSYSYETRNIHFYAGTIPSGANQPDLGARGNAVLLLAENIPRQQNHITFFDNWFSSLPLLSTLTDIGIGALGTVRIDRFPDIIFSTDQEMKYHWKGLL